MQTEPPLQAKSSSRLFHSSHTLGKMSSSDQIITRFGLESPPSLFTMWSLIIHQGSRLNDDQKVEKETRSLLANAGEAAIKGIMFRVVLEKQLSAPENGLTTSASFFRRLLSASAR